jgi:Winged helix DNA-binding domain
VERDRVLAFRAARHGLVARRPLTLAEAAACPASDFSRGWALLALAARSDGVTREAYDAATDSGQLVLAPSLRAAIHALSPADFALYGRALIAEHDSELGEQLGPQLERQLGAHRIAPTEALEEVAEATESTLAGGRALTKDELHAGLRARVREQLLPWCRGCGTHHVAPMLWRFAGVRAGMRCDSKRRFVLGEPGPAPGGAEAARRFLRFYGPSTAKDFGAWAGTARAHARRLWGEIEEELVEVRLEGRRTWLLAEDRTELDSPPQARGVRLLPPRDPYLQGPDRATLAPDPGVRKRLFRPIANPGAVLEDGRLVGLWRGRLCGKSLEVAVEGLEPIDRDELEAEAGLMAEVRGVEAAAVRWS